MAEQIGAAVIGLSGGLVIAGGVIALMVGLGIITRFAGITHTAGQVKKYESAIFSGIFVGGWILALAEIVNIFPIFARRIGITKGCSLIVIAIAAGKTVGSLYHFYMRWGI